MKGEAMGSILKTWVTTLGLRYQGVLVSAVRGCDVAPRHGTGKVLQRIYRGEILNAHCGEAAKAKTYILDADIPTVKREAEAFLEDMDHLPLHYVMHLVHAVEILGYFHPDLVRRDVWHSFYLQACKKMHVRPESIGDLRERLEADEDTFHRAQSAKVEARTHEARNYGGT